MIIRYLGINFFHDFFKPTIQQNILAQQADNMFDIAMLD